MRIALLLTALMVSVAAVPALAQTYGTGTEVGVPWVEPGTITLDGQMDEESWGDAVQVDATANWDGEWSGHPDPDVGAETRLLYTDDTLFVFHRISDYEVLMEPSTDQVLLGLDFVHEAGVSDQETDDGFSGFVDNAPEGPVTYKIFAGNDTLPPFTLNFNSDYMPADSGWVAGEYFFDDQTLEWGFEAAFISDAVGEGNAIGFNIGGGQAKEEGADDRGEPTYAFYSWQVCDPDEQENTLFCGAGGTVMSDAHSFATLVLGATVAIEEEKLDELPTEFALEQNYPNPFNPATTIEYSLNRAGNVSLDVFNLLGQRVAALVNEPRAAGTYRINWEADDLSSGMYIYQLRVDDQLVSSRTMMLVK